MARLLKPEPMQRTLILASKRHQAAVIETLHRLRVAHLLDYHEEGGEFSEFKLGAPLPAAGPASERLVRVRAILRHLGIENAEPSKQTSVRDLEARLDSDLDRIEREVTQAYEAREQLKSSLQEHQETVSKLQPLVPLPLKLEDYRGYDGLQVFVGRAAPGFDAEVARVAPDAMLVTGVEGGVFALFAPTAQASAVQEALYRNGYAEVEVPPGTGSPEERIRALEQEREQLARRAATADADLQRLAAEHRDLLLAAEEHLGIVVEKAEAPLFFASSENAFAADAWIPRNQVHVVERELHKATDGNVYLELVETGEMHAHHHPAKGAQADAAYDADANGSHHVDQHEQPPTKYANPKPARRFEWFTELFATPRYNEVDPTSIFAFFFPVFFGFMVADFGLGLAIAAIGFLLIRKLPKVDGMKQLGTAFVVAGLIAAAFGGVVFQDALGIPFGAPAQELEHLEHEGLIDGLTAPTLTAKGAEEIVAAGGHATAGSALSCESFAHLAHEWTWGCFVGGKDAAVTVTHPLLVKSLDIPTILLISVGAALIHLGLGLILGIRNEWGHGAKHVGAKIGFLLLLLSFYPAVIALLNKDFLLSATGLTDTTAYMIAGGGFVVGAVILGWAEGATGVLEIPTIFSNILSYLRLGAVAVAKGAMAVAFNNLTLVAAMTGGGLVLVLGLIGFVVAQVALLVLGILSGGIQALRLNFVEFYTKFYKGGGTLYKPFGRERKSTIPTSPSTP